MLACCSPRNVTTDSAQTVRLLAESALLQYILFPAKSQGLDDLESSQREFQCLCTLQSKHCLVSGAERAL